MKSIAGLSAEAAEELARYCRNHFNHADAPSLEQLPLADEPFVAEWEGYCNQSETEGVYPVLKRHLVQLSFPVMNGISVTQAYRAVTLRGEAPSHFAEATGLLLCHPERIDLFLQPTIAGRIPVITVPDRSDFVSLVQALSQRNEPHPLPDSMGACAVQGYNNWSRVHHYRQEWEWHHPGEVWALEFSAFREQKERYQDRFILLGSGPYSGIPAEAMGLQQEEWHALSRTIRLHHEITHYITRRLLGSMQSNILDELLADYMGIVAATGSFRAAWLLRFLGVEEYPHYRRGGRLENYQGKPPLSGESFHALQRITVLAAGNLELIDKLVFPARVAGGEQTSVLLALARMTLPELADESASELFIRYRELVKGW